MILSTTEILNRAYDFVVQWEGGRKSEKSETKAFAIEFLNVVDVGLTLLNQTDAFLVIQGKPRISARLSLIACLVSSVMAIYAVIFPGTSIASDMF